MLYLDSLDNYTQNSTQNHFAICHEDVKGIRTIRELTPSVELLKKWDAQLIEWEDFRGAFKTELRQEYNKGDDSRLKGLAKYSIENEVILYSPEPPGEQTYRAILAEVLNAIWENTGVTIRAIDYASNSSLAPAHRQQMEKIAHTCEHYEQLESTERRKSCLQCKYLDITLYTCEKLVKPVIQYEWSEPRPL